MSRLLLNLPRMTNTEKNNLAKNEYCDDDIQIWIAKNGNVRARYYLAENPAISEEAKEVLLDGRSNIAKGILVSNGVIRDAALVKEIYNALAKRSSTWRIMHFFVKNLYCYKRGGSIFPASPSEVLEDIFENRLSRPGDNHYIKFWSEALSKHPNCSTRLAIMMSQHPESRVKQSGFQALVRLEKEDK